MVVLLVLMAAGKRPKRFGYCYHVEIGKGWGGLELGVVFLTSANPSFHTKCHEHGHALQNCYFGPLMPFIVCIPSAARYWYREIRRRIGKPCKTDYDSIWFEGQATEWGFDLIYTNTIRG
jgi:hypothetical protein